MALGRRLRNLLAAGEPATPDPDAQVEVAVVPLAQGPLLVALLQDRGIDAVGLESFDVVTDTRSRMRVLVRHADRAAAIQVVEEEADADHEFAHDPGDEGDDGTGQAALSDLFLAADRLARAPWDAEQLAEVDRLDELVAGSPPPFGVEASAWEEVAELSAAILATDPGDEDTVATGARALRAFLREYV